jgi:alkylated DNA repair dioxygenase AlkB
VVNLLPADGEAILIPKFLNSGAAQGLLLRLKSTLAWEQYPIKLFGKTILQPRLIAFHGDSNIQYTYSRLTLKAMPWTKELLELKAALEQFCQQDFNSVLLNLYRDGSDSMGWHSDDERELGRDPMIASVSLGAERKFQFKHRSNCHKKQDVSLESGSLLVMAGACQTNWLHCLPRTTKPTGERINLTFRKVFPV